MNHHTFSYLPTQRRGRCSVESPAGGTSGVRYTSSAAGAESVRSPIRVTPSALPALVYAIIYTIEFQAPLEPRPLPLKLKNELITSSNLAFRRLPSAEAVNGATSTVLSALSSFLGRSSAANPASSRMPSYSPRYASEAASSVVSPELQHEAAARQRQREQPLVVPVTQVMHKLDGVHVVVRRVHCSTVELAKEKALREVHEIVIRHRERQEQLAAYASRETRPSSPYSPLSQQSRYTSSRCHSHASRPYSPQQQECAPNSDTASLMKMMSTHYRSLSQQILPAALAHQPGAVGCTSMRYPRNTATRLASSLCHTISARDVDQSSDVNSSRFLRAPPASPLTRGVTAVAPPMSTSSRCLVMPFPASSLDSSHSRSSAHMHHDHHRHNNQQQQRQQQQHNSSSSINNNNNSSNSDCYGCNNSARDSSCSSSPTSSGARHTMNASSATLSMLELRPGEIGMELSVRLLSREERWRMTYERPLAEWTFPIIRTKDEDVIMYLGTPGSTPNKPSSRGEWRSLGAASMSCFDGCAAYSSAHHEWTTPALTYDDGSGSMGFTRANTAGVDAGSVAPPDFIFVNDATQVNDVLYFILKTFYESINLETFADFTSGELVFDAHVAERRSFHAT